MQARAGGGIAQPRPAAACSPPPFPRALLPPPISSPSPAQPAHLAVGARTSPPPRAGDLVLRGCGLGRGCDHDVGAISSNLSIFQVFPLLALGLN